MKAVLHSDYTCAPDGHTTIRYKAGDVLEGNAACMALEDDAGFDPVEERKIEAPLETKRPRGRPRKDKS